MPGSENNNRRTLSSLTQSALVFASTLSVLSCKEDPGTAIPRLKKELVSSDRHTRNKAALAIASYGEDARPAVPVLTQLLRDSNGGVRSSAAFALRAIGGEEAEQALARATEAEKLREK